MWQSMRPGVTYRPFAASTGSSVAPRTSPTSTIRPSRMRMSPDRSPPPPTIPPPFAQRTGEQREGDLARVLVPPVVPGRDRAPHEEDHADERGVHFLQASEVHR